MISFHPRSLQKISLSKARTVVWITICVLAVALISTAVFSLLSPQPIPESAVITTDKTLSSPIGVSGELPMIPETLPYLQVSTSVPTSEVIFQKLSQLYDFTTQSSDKTIRMSEDGMISVQSKQNDQHIIFLDQRSLPINSPILSTLSLEEIGLRVKGFIDALSLFNSFSFSTSPEPVNFAVYNIVPASTDNIDGYVYKLYPTQSDIPILFNDQLLAPIEITIRADGEIVKAVFPKYTYNLSVVGEKKSLSSGQILKNITDGQIEFLRVDNSTITESAPQSIDNTILIPDRIEYRINESNGVMIPYLKLDGVGRSGDTVVDIVAITPIVPTQ